MVFDAAPAGLERARMVLSDSGGGADANSRDLHLAAKRSMFTPEGE